MFVPNLDNFQNKVVIEVVGLGEKTWQVFTFFETSGLIGRLGCLFFRSLSSWT
jgi:hypothetical protein